MLKQKLKISLFCEIMLGNEKASIIHVVHFLSALPLFLDYRKIINQRTKRILEKWKTRHQRAFLFGSHL